MPSWVNRRSYRLYARKISRICQEILAETSAAFFNAIGKKLNRVLIFGGAGFIGSHLARFCLSRRDEVHVAARPQTNLSRLQSIDESIKLHQFEFSDRDAMAHCFAEVMPHEVYQLATRTRWMPKHDLSDVSEGINCETGNLISIIAAAASAKSPPRVMVRTGSLAEYGNGPAPYLENQRENPLNAYAASLVASTHCSQMLQSRLPFPLLTARLALTYGPDQSADFLIPSLLQNCEAARTTSIRRPLDRRDMIYVSDVAEALTLLAGSKIPGGTIVNICTGNAPTVKQIALSVINATGSNPNLIEFSLGQKRVQTSSDSCLNFCGSPLLARKLLGWKAKIDLQKGLRLMLQPLHMEVNASREYG
jgi:UDP-glucose 4-epimerase